MRKSIPAPLAGLLALTAALPALAAEDKPLVAVTNTLDQHVAYCTLLVDGRARTKLAIRPGRTWSEGFDPRRELLLVCDRGTSIRFGPLKAGTSYRLVEAEGRKIELAEDGGR
jgi:hypothetical protein